MSKVLIGILAVVTAILSGACGNRTDTGACTGAGCGGAEACDVPAAWSSAGWHFKRAIQVSGTPAGTQAGYAVPVALDTATLVAAGKLQASGSDLRFVGASGAVLPWWRESSVPFAPRIWVKVDSIPPVGTVLHAYYGNPSATQDALTDNGRCTFDTFDDFGGTELNSALWWPSVADGTLALPEVTSGSLRFFAAGDRGVGATSSHRSAGSRAIEFNMSLTLTSACSNFWEVNVFDAAALSASARGSTQAIGRWRAGYWSCGQWEMDPPDGPVDQGALLGRIEIDASSSMLRFYSGSELRNAVSAPLPAAYVVGFSSYGGTGWGVYNSTELELHDFRVRPLATPEPVASTPGAEEAF